VHHALSGSVAGSFCLVAVDVHKNVDLDLSNVRNRDLPWMPEPGHAAIACTIMWQLVPLSSVSGVSGVSGVPTQTQAAQEED